MHFKNIIKKQFIISIISFSIVSLVVIGTSNAIFKGTVATASQANTTGTLNVAFNNSSGSSMTDANAINISGTNPLTDSDGISATNNTYAFVVANNGNIPYAYRVKLENNSSTLSLSYVRYCLYKGTGTPAASTCINPSGSAGSSYITNIASMTNGVIYNGLVNAGASDSFKLKVWVQDGATYGLPNTAIGQTASLKINICGEAATNASTAQFTAC